MWLTPQINAFPTGVDPGEGRSFITVSTFTNDKDTEMPFAMYGYAAPGWTSDIHLVYYSLYLRQVA